MDYKAISKAITDPENQPHQWNDQDLAEFFVSAADEIERLREQVKELATALEFEANYDGHKLLARSALQQKENE